MSVPARKKSSVSVAAAAVVRDKQWLEKEMPKETICFFVISFDWLAMALLTRTLVSDTLKAFPTHNFVIDNRHVEFPFSALNNKMLLIK